MNINSFDYFLACVEEGSFTAAAESLNITQQTLSAHVKSLEAEFGSVLLVRSTPLRLTREGEVFAEHCRMAKRTLSMVRRDFPIAPGQGVRVVSIGVSHTLGAELVPRAISEVSARDPSVRVRLFEGSNEEVAGALLEGKVDIAVADIPDAMSGFEVRRLCEDEVVCAVPKSLILEAGMPSDFFAGQSLDLLPCEMGAVPFCLSKPHDVAGRMGREILERSGIVAKTVLECESMITLLRACAMGAAACFCPARMLRSELQPEALEHVEVLRFGDQGRFSVSLGVPAQMAGDRRITMILDALESASLRRC